MLVRFRSLNCLIGYAFQRSAASFGFNTLSSNYFTTRTSFAPRSRRITRDDVETVGKYIFNAKKLLIVTGAGVSTESGIPDYRSEGVGLYARSNHRPMSYSDFLRNDYNRKRYWSRNFVGWPQFSSHRPTLTHDFIVSLEQVNDINWLITQNVDRLHHQAGSSKVTELHGTSHEVICLTCGQVTSRHKFQKVLMDLNPNWTAEAVQPAPDGDVFIDENLIKEFNLAKCDCGGILKPNVVFFGGTVDKKIAAEAIYKVDEADSILVVGSSLQTYSVYRILLRAYNTQKQIGIVNIGNTRADHLASFKINVNCDKLFAELYAREGH